MQNTGQAPKRFIVEGWRFVPHSYAIVNQWQLLALSRRPDVAVKVADTPFYRRRWQTLEGLFNKADEQILKSLAVSEVGERADVTLRISSPFDFSPSLSKQTVVFGTSETQVLRKDQFSNTEAFGRFQRTLPPKDIKVITPSRWSAEGFYQAGFAHEQVLIIPHGVDVDTFHPMPDVRMQVRGNLCRGGDEFVFLSVGAMTGNKGIDLLLKAFSEISRRFSGARLILKGMNSLYQSEDLLDKHMQTMSAVDRQLVKDRMTYFGDPFSNDKMAKLYQVADTYVSPYRAEGFNIPVLEAAASGIPVICTDGGATDDFVTNDFARKIESQKSPVPGQEQPAYRLEPNLEHLIALMESAIEDRLWRARAAEAGPNHVRGNYTWDRVVEMLVQKLMD
ncbi:MAG TPA: glycosyltransferase [Rhizomicrobium sp.]|nr:glycosyltransferase [Rhizomicrobium sp.]